MAITCSILNLSKNGLHHWILRIFPHIFGYLYRNFAKSHYYPSFSKTTGDANRKIWPLRHRQGFIVSLNLHVQQVKKFPVNTTPWPPLALALIWYSKKIRQLRTLCCKNVEHCVMKDKHGNPKLGCHFFSQNMASILTDLTYLWK